MCSCGSCQLLAFHCMLLGWVLLQCCVYEVRLLVNSSSVNTLHGIV